MVGVVFERMGKGFLEDAVAGALRRLHLPDVFPVERLLRKAALHLLDGVLQRKRAGGGAMLPGGRDACADLPGGNEGI